MVILCMYIVQHGLFVTFKDSYNRTKKLLLRKKDKLTKLAEMLMKYETLDMEEIRLIMEGKDIVRS